MSFLKPRARANTLLETASTCLTWGDVKQARTWGLIAIPIALLDIAAAIREHTARTTHPAGKDNS